MFIVVNFEKTPCFQVVWSMKQRPQDASTVQLCKFKSFNEKWDKNENDKFAVDLCFSSLRPCRFPLISATGTGLTTETGGISGKVIYGFGWKINLQICGTQWHIAETQMWDQIILV